ncbi:MAG: DUF5678 domain-containing protein [Acidobacteria bacterium]|nr:DUF5678 domain-containing protein [Acidobacteriota bacterium]
MSNEKLGLLKEQLAKLPPREKLELAQFLIEQAGLHQAEDRCGGVEDQFVTDFKRAQHMAWLIEHREEYAGRYIALDGDLLVGAGATIREAHEQARRQGVERPFLTHVSSANDAPFGGW